MKKNNKGFSLVELIVVIAIMAILAGIAIPTFAVFINNANEASDESYMNDIKYAIELALADEAGTLEGYEVRVTIDDDGKFTYAYVYIQNSTVTYNFDADDMADIQRMLGSDYTAKGLKKGTYHKDGDDWVDIKTNP